MSHEKGIPGPRALLHLQPQSTADSSIVLSGRCTSTPINVHELFFSRLDTSIAASDAGGDDSSLSRMDASSVPIFGRRNLQLLRDCQNYGDEPGVDILKKCGGGHHMVNADKTFDDKAQPSSSGSLNTQKESKETKRKISASKRRSTANEPRGPTFKTMSKLPKSPRSLTAIRAKLKMNRDKSKKANAEVAKENQKVNNAKQACAEQMHSPPKVKYSKFKITIPISPKLGRAKISRRM
ncbi:uncharacterized protein LOC131673201 isoform X2 [Phymastichus coffea]|uniref:uncharacterized protein LOC131673201 isoform X2 n=1 Tax=Phymastichus coffea TaxID=108790 RepID=UPI00273BB14B|nr:uncharacterized protein LOC131673201 isoform X2 [Phymastichus coffea]